MNGDKTKLDGIEARQTDLLIQRACCHFGTMDSEVNGLAGIKSVTISTLQPKPEGAFVDGDKTKLDDAAYETQWH